MKKNKETELIGSLEGLKIGLEKSTLRLLTPGLGIEEKGRFRLGRRSRLSLISS